MATRIAVLPEVWLMHPETSADEIAVLCVLALHAGKDGTCFPSQGLLASILGRSRPWVCKVIGRLVELGLVERTHRQRNDGGDRTCLYRLAQPLQSKAKSSVPADDTPVSAENTGSHVGDSVKTIKENNKETHTTDAHGVSQPLGLISMAQPQTPAEDFQPTDSDLIWAIERFPQADLHAHTERFVHRCRAKGYRFRSLSDAWRSWLADDQTKPRVVMSKGRDGAAAQAKFEAWAGVASRATAPRGGLRHAA
ncbi:MAG: helix-turn-helix domain-containing protein [Rhodospirillaceae bacterium]